MFLGMNVGQRGFSHAFCDDHCSLLLRRRDGWATAEAPRQCVLTDEGSAFVILTEPAVSERIGLPWALRPTLQTELAKMVVHMPISPPSPLAR
jgi:hypothetical protein